MNDINNYDEIPFRDELFPIRIIWKKELKGRDNDQNVCNSAANIFDGTWHEQLEIIYFISGEAVVKCGSRYYDCAAGDIVIINPCEMHYVDSRCSTAVFHCFMIDPKLYGGGDNDLCGIKYMTPLSDSRLSYNNKVSENQRVREILDSFISECENCEPAYEIAVKGYILLLLSELTRHEQRLIPVGDEERRNAKGYMQIEPALRIISSSYAREITLSELATSCHLAPSYFCRRFREVMKMTATDYINEYRITKAETLLLTTDLTISQIAQRSGFSDSGYFSRIFHNLRGMSPSTVRNSKAVEDSNNQ